MPSKATVPERLSARERLLAAAGELFYEEGINTVGIDRVIERAGVAKASLYNAFGSKDELICAYLAARQEVRRERIELRLTRHDTPRERILAVFEDMAEMASKPGFRGCAFVRASAELRSDSSVRQVCDQSRGWLRDLFAGLSGAAGVKDTALLAAQLMLLYDGAAVSGHLDAARGAAVIARDAAARLLDANGVT
jgi:AcrR family transcriptional regulator